MLPSLCLFLAIFVVVFIIVAALQPAGFRYERKTAIAAPPAVVFGFVNDLQRFQDWSPWAKRAPLAKIACSGPVEGSNATITWEMFGANNRKTGRGKVIFTGPVAGVGAAFAWEEFGAGGRMTNAGRMSLTESRPSELLRFRLDFLRPFKATNTAEFVFTPEAGGTTVTWSMTGKNSFAFKAFGLVVNCDKMIGRDFEKGLASLKALAEAAAKK